MGKLREPSLRVLKIVKSEGEDLVKALAAFSMAHQSMPHTSTGITPFDLVLGCAKRTKLPMYNSDAKVTVHESRDFYDNYKLKVKEYANRGTKEPPISHGDTVVMRQEVSLPSFVGLSGNVAYLQKIRTL